MAVVFMLREAGINKPFRMVKDLLPTIEEEVPEPYSEEELKKIFAAIEDDREYAAIMFFLVTACREKEVAFARWDDLKMIEGKPHYPVQAKAGFTTKNHTKRDIQINQELVDLLAGHRKTVNGSEWIFPNRDGQSDGHFLRKFKKIVFKAGLNCGRCKTRRKVVTRRRSLKSVARTTRKVARSTTCTVCVRLARRSGTNTACRCVRSKYG